MRSLIFLVGGIALQGCTTSAPVVRTATVVTSRPTTEWQLVPGWPRLSPGVRLGEVSGVDLDTRGHVMVFHRAGRAFDRTATEPIAAPTVVELDALTGDVINSWGAGLFLIPHSITVDSRDNVWLTDVGRHQVFKFSHDGTLVMTVGERRVPGWDATHFNEPTDVAVAADGSFYVSDGYQNARVARFSAVGAFVREWGSKGIAPGQFRTPHGVVLDDRGRLLVADRENSRLQLFDTLGALMRSWPGVHTSGRVFDIAVSGSGTVYVVRKDGASAVEILDRDLSQIGRIAFDTSRFVTPHAIAVQGDSVIYIADTGGRRVLKFVKR